MGHYQSVIVGKSYAFSAETASSMSAVREGKESTAKETYALAYPFMGVVMFRQAR